MPPTSIRSRRPAGHAALLRAFTVRAVLLTVIWWVLAGTIADAWLVGGSTVLLGSAVSLMLQPPANLRLSIAGTARFIVFFVIRSIKGGLQVASMAFSRRPGLQPALLEIPLRLSDESERIILAGTLSLLPGTLSVDLQGNLLRLHVLDSRMPIENDLRRAEAMVARMFGGMLR